MAQTGVKGCSCNATYNAPAMDPIPADLTHSSKGASVTGRTSAGGSGPPPSIPKIESIPPAPPTEDELSEEELEKKLRSWNSPLRQFDSFATNELRRRAIAEEDFPRLQVPQMKGHHRCRVSCLLNHNVDYAVEMEQDLRNIGIQETHMLDMLEKLTKAEAAVRFQGAVRAAEVAAMSAPPDLAEEAAVAGARGYSVETQEFSKKSNPGENPIEIVGYIGCTRPNNF